MKPQKKKSDNLSKSKETSSLIVILRRKTKWIIALITGLAIASGYFLNIDDFIKRLVSKTEIDVDIAYYEKSGSKLRIVDPTLITLDVTPEDYFLKKKIPFSLNLAIRNKDTRPLDVTGVDLIYDKEIDIESQGHTKIDPKNKHIVYRHQIDKLDDVDFFTPLKTVDTIYLPTSQLVTDETIALLKDGVPVYFATAFTKAGGIKLRELKIPFEIKIYCKDRPVFKESFSVWLICDFKILFPGNFNAVLVSPTKHDLDSVIDIISQEKALIEQWENKQSFDNHSIKYSKMCFNSGIYQAIYIDQQLRKIIADTDSDSYVDYELMDTDFDGILDKKALFETPKIMFDWKESASY